MSGAKSVTYRLAESYVTIAGTVTYETDPYSVPDGQTPTEVADPDATRATVALGVRGDGAASALREVSFDKAIGDGTVTDTRLPDERLTSLDFNTAGVGARLVSAGATVLAYVGGLAASVVGGGPARRALARRPGVESFGGAGEGNRPAGEQEEEEPTTPEGRARKAWTADHPREAQHRAEYQALLAGAEATLRTWREAAVDATTGAAAREALATARRLEAVVRDARAEIDRVDSLYAAWRARTIAVRTESRSYDLSIAELGAWSAGTPDPGSLTGAARAAWDHLGVIVGVEPLEARPAQAPGAPEDTQHWMESDRGNARRTEERVSWRVPRRVRVWVWRRGAAGAPALERVSNAMVVDSQSVERDLEVDAQLFGESSAILEFGDFGMPTKVTAGSKSALGALADALRGAPEAIASGLESAKKAQAAYVGLEDAREQHRLDVLKRRKDILQARLDIKGLDATAGDFGELKRLEQQVAIAEAQGSLTSSPPSELELLQDELELARTEAALRKLRAGGDPDADRAPSIEERLASLEAKLEDLARP